MPYVKRRGGLLGTGVGGPFPSDRFTVPDTSQNTGLRINLPKPDCGARPSDCEDLDVINTLDGFNMSPRISIPFDGSIDVNSVNSRTVFLVSLGNTLDPGDLGGRRIGINEIVWDVASNTLHVWSDELLDQHTRYGLIVTRGVRDARGDPIEASAAFRAFLATGMGDYWTALVAAVRAAVQTGIAESDTVSASIFTTRSATAMLEKIRDQIKASTPAPADFRLGPGGSPTVFDLNQVSGITLNVQMRVNPATFTASQLNLSVLGTIPGAVGRIAFGRYRSPDYLVHPGEYIPAVSTRTGQPAVQGMSDIYFTLYLPSAPRSAAGWPVAIFGHQNANNKESVRVIAATMAAHGIATIAINAFGQGRGPLGTLTVNQTAGGSVTLPSGGRGLDLNGDGLIGGAEGILASSPRSLIVQRDTNFQQTPADLIQLVRVIDLGMDVDGDGRADLDPSRIYYVGQSGAGTYGIQFFAVEPNVRAVVPYVAGGGWADAFRLAPFNRSANGTRFVNRQPSIINGPGITILDGIPVAAPYFNENQPLRNGVPMMVRLEDGMTREIRSPVINTVTGAMQIQEWFDRMSWAYQSGNPAAYAPHLRKNPLPGMAVRPVLFQFVRGDLGSPNPINTQILRTGDLADRATFYRNDLAYAEDPSIPKDNSDFMTLGIERTGLALAIAAADRCMEIVKAQVAGRAEGLESSDQIRSQLSQITAKRQGGLVRLLRALQEAQIGEDLQRLIMTWKEMEDKAQRRIQSARMRFIRRRHWLYQNLAAWIAGNYDVISWEDDLDIKEMVGKRERPEALERADRYRQIAAIGEFRAILRRQAAKHHSLLIDGVAAYSTIRCFTCGAHTEGGAELKLQCSEGHAFDQDENAARWFLSEVNRDVLSGCQRRQPSGAHGDRIEIPENGIDGEAESTEGVWRVKVLATCKRLLAGIA